MSSLSFKPHTTYLNSDNAFESQPIACISAFGACIFDAAAAANALAATVYPNAAVPAREGSEECAVEKLSDRRALLAENVGSQRMACTAEATMVAKKMKSSKRFMLANGIRK
eukprot:652917-Pleurochrysis_carterae.AAC.1